MADGWFGGNIPAAFLDNLLAVFGQSIGTFLFVWDLKTEEYYISPYAMDRYDIPDYHLTNAHEVWVRNVYAADSGLVSDFFARLRQGEIDRFEHDYRMRGRGGDVFWVTTRARLLRDDAGAPAIMVGSVVEIESERGVDPVTGLLNFRQLSDDFEASVPEWQHGYFMVLGLDGFSAINDHYGHRAGDKLLKAFARLLEQRASGAQAYRLTGDRFGVMLPGKSTAAVELFYQGIRQDFAQLQKKLGHDEICTVSAGVTAYPADSAQFNHLLQYADNALASAKQSGKNRLVYFSRRQYSQYLEQIAIREEVRQCVQNGFTGFTLHYQPLVSATRGQVEGAEALLRWTSPEHGRVPPSVLVPMLLETGLMLDVGNWVLDKALAQCQRWRKHLPDFRVNVNIDPIQMEKGDLPGTVLSLLRHYRLPGSALMLELTGDTLIDDLQPYHPIFKRLGAIGVDVAQDDLGTGYARLGNLHKVGIARLKLDRRFTARLFESDLDYRLTQFVVEMAQNIGVKVTIEGVETEAMAKRMLTLAPDTLQGFYFSRPLSAATFTKKLVGAWHCNHPWPLLQADKPEAEQPSKAFRMDFIGAEGRQSLLDELLEIVMISDIDTCEVLYLNRTGRDFYRVDDYTGLCCHEVCFRRSTPCDDCQRERLNTQVFTSFEYSSSLMGGHYLTRAQKIPWNDRDARLAITLPPGTNPRTTAATLQLKVEKTIVASVLALADGRNIEEAITAVLGEIGKFYQADRSYIFELDDNGDMAGNIYEWCARNIAPELIHHQRVNLRRLTPIWLASLQNRQPIVIESLEAFQALYPGEFEYLIRPNITRYMVVPFFHNDHLAGFIGVDNPRYAKSDPALLCSLVYFIANEISKRRMASQLHRLSYVDKLTGVYNHNRYLEDRQALQPQHCVALGVVFVDINGLKQVNDTQGHAKGDELIRHVAADLRDCFTGHPVYRIGGDEFVIICENIEQAALEDAVLCVRDSASRHGYSVSVGSAWADRNIELQRMAHAADAEMYANKRAFYNSGNNRRSRHTISQE